MEAVARSRLAGGGRIMMRPYAGGANVPAADSRAFGLNMTPAMTLDEQFAYLTKGCVDVVRAQELRTKLERSATTGVPLTVKVGFDPTAPDLHLGHTVLLRKMKHFQDCGHRVVFLIGDFTGLIGDPTGRSKTRPSLTREEIDVNAETYKAQVFKLLDPVKTVVDFNSRWLGELGSFGWVKLSSRYNVAQMLERRDFRQRYEAKQPIALHEFMYSLAQGYDSVALKADVELGGTDQLFNLNVGRDIMPGFGLEAQIVMTVPLLVGLDGVEKMSKSYGNYVGIAEAPAQMFGKVMSVSDELMWTYYTLLTDRSQAEIDAMRAAVEAGTQHPKAAKVALASSIVADFHGAEAARAAAEAFERVFSRGELPEELPEVSVAEGLPIEKVLVAAGLASSGTDAYRKVSQGAVRVNGERYAQVRSVVGVSSPYVVQVGRRGARIVVGAEKKIEG